jgi:hypothetical protein
MNSTDWVIATGSALVRGNLGGYARPLNPKLLARQVTKAKPVKSRVSARQSRKLVVQVHRLAGEVDDLLSPAISRQRARAATHSPSLMAQSAPGAAGLAAQARHNAIVQRWRKGF